MRGTVGVKADVGHRPLPKSNDTASSAWRGHPLAIIAIVNAPRTDYARIVLPDRRSLALDGRTWAEVSLATLRENFRVVQQHVGANVAICAVVKADGYGHGATECALALEAEGAPWLGVTDAAEGRALRSAGIWTRILLMTGIWKGEEDGIVSHNLTPTVWEPWHIERLEKAAKKQQINLPVHLKVDTGMNRLGAALEALARTVREARRVPTPAPRRREHAFRLGGGARRPRRSAANEGV